jgi:hypothetical protein
MFPTTATIRAAKRDRVAGVQQQLPTGKVVSDCYITEGLAMQLDESTDVTGLSDLLVFVRYMHNSYVQTAGEDIFKLTDSYMTDKGLSWK